MTDHNYNQSSPTEPKLADEKAIAIALDILSSVVLFLFGIYVFCSGLYMCFFATTGTKVWYYSPGFFPAFIGVVIMLLSSILYRKKYTTEINTLQNLMKVLRHAVQPSKSGKLALSVGMFAFYIFVLIGRIPFVAATFIYLSATMICFRTEQYPVWKLLLISGISTGAIYLFFGVVAAVPLP